jgi:hypothetical protein
VVRNRRGRGGTEPVERKAYQGVDNAARGEWTIHE